MYNFKHLKIMCLHCELCHEQFSAARFARRLIVTHMRPPTSHLHRIIHALKWYTRTSPSGLPATIAALLLGATRGVERSEPRSTGVDGAKLRANSGVQATGFIWPRRARRLCGRFPGWNRAPGDLRRQAA